MGTHGKHRETNPALSLRNLCAASFIGLWSISLDAKLDQLLIFKRINCLEIVRIQLYVILQENSVLTNQVISHHFKTQEKSSCSKKTSDDVSTGAGGTSLPRRAKGSRAGTHWERQVTRSKGTAE